ncbi:MAG: aspartate-semialdehyde dehydrogenase [Candidatus Velthaea sp.]|jgi:aspartate-semialdehyde dehydrogenase
MRVAIVGATGVVGQTILQILDERAIAIDTLLAYASRDRETGIVFRGKAVPVFAASTERIRADRPDVVFFASSDDASEDMAEALAAGGAFVIDNSATFRLDPRVPLVIPEVNPHAIGADHRIFPVANCTAIVLCVALAPVERAIGLASVRVATYQAVSGAGRAGLETLANEEAAALAKGPQPGRGAFAAPIFRNVVPQVGSYDGDGDTGEEQKVVAETRKMLERPDLHVAATTVRVPVRRAHSEAVFFETKRTTTRDELEAVFAAAPGVVYHPRGIVTPLDVEGTDLVHVARVRPEPDSDTHWQMWIVGDQLRKGAATNAVQILQTLVEQGRFAVAAGAPQR